MFKNYIKIAWRNLIRNRVFSTINIVGLAIGLASCMLISLYVLDELSFDRFNEKSGQIVRVVFKGTMQGGKINEAHVMPPTAQALKSDYPEVLEATRIRQAGQPKIMVGEKSFSGDNVAFADPNIFQVFTLPLVKGDARTALAEPNSLVISQKVAEKFYGTQDAIGKVLNFKGDSTNFKITGVMKEIPRNSHFHYDIFVSISNQVDAKSNSWMTSEFFTYLLLQKGYDYKKLETKLPQTVAKYIGPQLTTAMGVTLQEFNKSGNTLGLYLQPLTDIHLHSDFQYDLGTNGSIKYVYIFGVVATIMLIIACINFMNLSTATASKRAREVGVRKVMGSERKELIWQFLLESVLLTSLSLLLASLIAYLALPVFNTLSGKELSLESQMIPGLLPKVLLFGLLVGVLAGSYPAFFLSSFKPVAVLKGRVASNNKTINFRSGLVVVQFCISIVLIIGTTVVYQQLRFIQNKKLGYEKDQVLIVDSWPLGKNQGVFRDELLRNPNVVNVSVSSYIPAGPSYNNNYMVYPDEKTNQLVKTLRYDVDANYIPTMGMTMATGRNFSKDFGNDSSSVILNETAAEMLGFKENALGRTITSTGNDGQKSTFRVVGVVKDFHFRSMHERIAPLVMELGKEAGNMIIKVKTENVPAALAGIRSAYNVFKPEIPFGYSFLDERFNNTYLTEQKTGQILGFFAGLTIFVASLGLFGLAAFTAQQRTKEIGVRKVLGASVGSIVALLSGEFLRLVIVSLIVASPIAWYLMNSWLQGFEYKITIEWWVFVIAGLLSVGIALLTVSYQSIKAALLDPVKSIKSE